MKRAKWLGEYDEVIFSRSNLVTFGAFIILLAVIVIIGAELTSFVSLILPAIFAFIGLVFIYSGLFSSSKTVVDVADATSKSDMFILINILSTPLYWIWMKLRKDQNKE